MTTCPFKLKFIIVDYLQSYKTLQLFENIFTFNTNKFTTINVKKHTCTDTEVLKMLRSLKLGLN